MCHRKLQLFLGEGHSAGSALCLSVLGKELGGGVEEKTSLGGKEFTLEFRQAFEF